MAAAVFAALLALSILERYAVSIYYIFAGNFTHLETFNKKLPAQSANAKLRKVLIIDDSHFYLGLIQFFMDYAGHTSKTAQTADEAITIAGEFVPDAALLNVELPDMDGFSLARALRSTCPHIFLIGITGRFDEEKFRQSREAGINHHVMKPIDPLVLFKLLA